MRISLYGLVVESVGLLLDIMHHLNIGLETEEGLLTWQHGLIVIGFLVMTAGVLKMHKALKK